MNREGRSGPAKQTGILQDASGNPFFSHMANDSDEISAARDLGHRYRCEFVDLHNFQTLPEVLKNAPIELMFRYDFVALEQANDGRLAIAIADPGQLMRIDEISCLLNQRIIIKVSTLSQIRGVLNKVVDEAKRIDENPT
jgi:type IV pilus assembly protein PilB